MSRYRDNDPALRRIERDSIVIGVVAALGALAIDHGRLSLVCGVVAGAGMATVAYTAVRSAVNAILGRARARAGDDNAAPPNTRRAVTMATVRFISRYGIVAAVAVLALGPLRADPIGLFVGVSIPVVAIAIEALRLLRGSRRRSW